MGHPLPPRSLPIGIKRYLSDPVANAWANFIRANGPWHWFASFTFKRFLSVQEAEGAFREWMRRLRQAIPSSRGMARVRYVLALEYQHRGAIHLHALLSHPRLFDMNRRRWSLKWERVVTARDLKAGCQVVQGEVRGMARIYPARARSAPYVAKYISKGGQMTIGGFRHVGINPHQLATRRPGNSFHGGRRDGVAHYRRRSVAPKGRGRSSSLGKVAEGEDDSPAREPLERGRGKDNL